MRSGHATGGRAAEESAGNVSSMVLILEAEGGGVQRFWIWRGEGGGTEILDLEGGGRGHRGSGGGGEGVTEDVGSGREVTEDVGSGRGGHRGYWITGEGGENIDDVDQERWLGWGGLGQVCVPLAVCAVRSVQ